MPAASHLPFGSVNASVAMVSPDAIPGSSLPFCSSVPAFMIASAASTTVEKYGAHSSTRPISSSTMPSSTNVKPWPPYSSGMWRLWSPSSLAIWLHTAGSYPSVVSIRRRTSVDGDFASRNRRTASRSCSCSSEKAKFTVRAPRCVGAARLECRERYRTGRRRPATARDGVPAYPGSMPRPAHYETADVRIEKLVVGPFENNVFVVRCKGTGEAVIIDAANEHELLLEVSRATGVRRVLTTHGHWDHIQAVEAVRDAGIDVGIAAEDASMLPAYDFVIPDDEVIAVGDLRLRTIHNPGHTPGSTSFLLEGHPILFSGDTLFPGGAGNTSFPGGDFEQIIESIDRRLFTLPADLLVLPGHGLDTTIGTERPHLQEWVDRGW